jgi:CheY-like chemotaxis protein
VLLVEDHPGVLKATQLLLTLEGYTVVAALSRAEALARIREDPNIDLLITDYHLSDDETGDEVIAAVRSALKRELPAVLVTGDTSSAVRKLRDDPHLRFASKPINADELIAVMSELLQRRV